MHEVEIFDKIYDFFYNDISQNEKLQSRKALIEMLEYLNSLSNIEMLYIYSVNRNHLIEYMNHVLKTIKDEFIYGETEEDDKENSFITFEIPNKQDINKNKIDETIGNIVPFPSILDNEDKEKINEILDKYRNFIYLSILKIFFDIMGSYFYETVLINIKINKEFKEHTINEFMVYLMKNLYEDVEFEIIDYSVKNHESIYNQQTNTIDEDSFKKFKEDLSNVENIGDILNDEEKFIN